jgi:hypothetical protein
VNLPDQRQDQSGDGRTGTMRGYRLSLVFASVAIAAMAVAPLASATPRSGDVHIVKDCTDYHGAAGEFCTITTSNVPAIPTGARIVYESDLHWPVLDTDISIAAGPGNVATGHCTLNFEDLPGTCRLSGGTGKFTHIQLDVSVSPDAEPNVWHWDGTFSFSPRS